MAKGPVIIYVEEGGGGGNILIGENFCQLPPLLRSKIASSALLIQCFIDDPPPPTQASGKVLPRARPLDLFLRTNSSKTLFEEHIRDFK